MDTHEPGGLGHVVSSVGNYPAEAARVSLILRRLEVAFIVTTAKGLVPTMRAEAFTRSVMGMLREGRGPDCKEGSGLLGTGLRTGPLPTTEIAAAGPAKHVCSIRRFSNKHSS